VTPDLCTLAKAVANGLPLAVVAGKREYMKVLSPLGPAAHSGTYSGHLFAILAALASLREITKPGFYDQIFKNAGYRTLFIHGARTGSFGFDAFSRRAGFDRYIGMAMAARIPIIAMTINNSINVKHN
jgi:acetylornithine/succinyldiaminopimelate/putrescine aminotransferase